mgnify:CR=1 FL=1
MYGTQISVANRVIRVLCEFSKVLLNHNMTNEGSFDDRLVVIKLNTCDKLKVNVFIGVNIKLECLKNGNNFDLKMQIQIHTHSISFPFLALAMSRNSGTMCCLRRFARSTTSGTFFMLLQA